MEANVFDVNPRDAMKYLLKGYPVIRYDAFTDEIADILKWNDSLGIVRLENRNVDSSGEVPTKLVLPHTKLRVFVMNKVRRAR